MDKEYNDELMLQWLMTMLSAEIVQKVQNFLLNNDKVFRKITTVK